MHRYFMVALLLLGSLLFLRHGVSARAGAGADPSLPRVPAAREGVRDDPNGRIAWFLRGRLLSLVGLAGAESPADRLISSFQQLKGHKLSLPAPRVGLAGAGFPNWAPLGPSPQLSSWGPVSGRITSLATDLVHDPTGNTVYVGSAFGGLWRSTNAQSTDSANPPHFEPLVDIDHWYSLSVGSIALDTSANPPTIYVGTGEANNALDSYYGVGILKSSDGGATWTGPVTTASDAQHSRTFSFVGGSISKMLIDPHDPKVLLAAVGSASQAAGRQPDVGIYESHDGGSSWIQTLNLVDAQQVAHDCTDLIYEPTQGTYYAALRGLGVYRYQLGQAWVATSSPFPGVPLSWESFYRTSLTTRTRGGVTTLWALNANRTGSPWPSTPSATGLAESVDGGTSWHALAMPAAAFGDSQNGWQGWYDQYLSAISDDDNLVLGGIDVWISHLPNGMQTSWSNLTNSYSAGSVVHPDQHALIVVGKQNWIIGNDGGIWSTGNAGANWKNLNTDLNTIQFMSVSPDLSNNLRVFGGSQDNGTAINGDGGLTWKLVLDGDGGYSLIDPQNPSHYFAEQYHVSLYRSDNSGNNWIPVVEESKIKEREAFYIPYQLLPGNPRKLVLGTFRVWRGPASPTFSGQGWAPISGDLTAGGDYDYVQSLAVSSRTAGVVYASTSDGKVWVSRNANGVSPSWQDITGSELPKARPFSAVAVSPTNSQQIYLGVQGFDTGHIFKCCDATGKWANVNGNLPNTPVNDILIDPKIPNDVYVATDIGVFVTSDGGTEHSEWTLYDGTHLPKSAVLQIRMSPNRQIFAATHGRGAWHIDALHDQPSTHPVR